MADDVFKTAPHTPAHLFRAGAVYFVTGATYQRLPYMRSDTRKEQWLNAFRKAAEIYDWEIIAWVVLSNHYHYLARAPEESAENLPKFAASYHKFTAIQWNREDNAPGRKVWWNYWDTCMRSERDYLARLNYVHWNPVKHGIVRRMEDYAWSSYRAFLAEQAAEIRRIEAAYPFDGVKGVSDDY